MRLYLNKDEALYLRSLVLHDWASSYDTSRVKDNVLMRLTEGIHACFGVNKQKNNKEEKEEKKNA